jgi:hypothetical protein
VLRALDSTRVQLLVLGALFVLSLPLVTTRIYASDEVQYFAYLRSLWFDHDVSFENEYQHFYDAGVVQYPGFHETFLERQTETGRRLTFATIGSALLWSPFYAVADGYVRVARMLGSDLQADGYAQPYVSAVAYGSAVYAWLAIVCGWLIARRVLGDASAMRADADSAEAGRTDREGRERREAGRSAALPAGAARVSLWASLAVWIGTPLFFYMYIAPPMAHACSAFAVAAFVLVWLHVRERWCLRGLILLGALAGLMGMVREQDLFIAIGPALDWAWTVWRRASGDDASASAAVAGEAPSFHARVATPPSVAALLLRGMAGAAAFVIAYTPQLAAYVVLNGYPGPSRLVVRKMNFAAPHALGVLASPEHGLVFWTPLVVLALIGLVWLLVAKRGPGDAAVELARGDARRIALCVLVMIASQIYIAGSVESWTVAGAFGQRRFVGLSALLVLGLAAFIRALRDGWLRRVGFALAALTVWWNLGLMAQFGAGLMDRQRLELGRNTYNSFVTIPLKVPELAYRYVFARRSFYRPAGEATPPPGPGASDTRTPAAGDATASPGDGRPR